MITASAPRQLSLHFVVILTVLSLATASRAFCVDLEKVGNTDSIHPVSKPLQDTIRHVQIKILAKELPVIEKARPNLPEILPGTQNGGSRYLTQPFVNESRRITESKATPTKIIQVPVKRTVKPSVPQREVRHSSEPVNAAIEIITQNPRKAKVQATRRQNPTIKQSQQKGKTPTAKPNMRTLPNRIMLAFVIMLMAGFGYLIWLYDKKSRSHSELEAQNAEMKSETAIIEKQTKTLEELNELKDRLFAIVSHDLRSPIGNLRAILEMFKKEGMSVEEISEIITEMVPSVENADMIISNLLTWAVNQRDGLKLNKSSFSYNFIVEETIRSFTYLLTAKKIQTENLIDPYPAVYADADQVKIIVRNLVSNAVKFAPIGGRVKFYSHESEQELVLAVEDNGKGLSNEEINNLFSTKTHFSKDGTKGEKGAGIGLLLCKEMAALNDGTIYVDSIPGESCTFYLKLPKSEVPEPIF